MMKSKTASKGSQYHYDVDSILHCDTSPLVSPRGSEVTNSADRCYRVSSLRRRSRDVRTSDRAAFKVAVAPPFRCPEEQVEDATRLRRPSYLIPTGRPAPLLCVGLSGPHVSRLDSTYTCNQGYVADICLGVRLWATGQRYSGGTSTRLVSTASITSSSTTTLLCAFTQFARVPSPGETFCVPTDVCKVYNSPSNRPYNRTCRWSRTNLSLQHARDFSAWSMPPTAPPSHGRAPGGRRPFKLSFHIKEDVRKPPVLTTMRATSADRAEESIVSRASKPGVRICISIPCWRPAVLERICLSQTSA